MLSVPEIVRSLLSSVVDVAPGGVVVGPASLDEQEAGCVALNEQGLGARTGNVPLVRHRMAARCLAPTLEQAERIASAVFDVLHQKGRRVAAQLSTGKKYLVHWTEVRGGPTALEGEERGIWEEVVMIEALVGTEEVV